MALPGIMGTKAIKWNFTKFLVNKDGLPVTRFAPNESPLDLKKDIDGAYDAIEALIERKLALESKLRELNHPELIKN